MKATTMGAGAACLALGALIMSAAGGCLFDTRTPIPPRITQQCPLIVVSAPDSVLSGLIQAFACRDSTGAPTGSGNYDGLLADDFNFLPDPNDTLDFVSIDPSNSRFIHNWNRDKELEVFSSLAASSDSIGLEFNNVGQPGPQEIQANYLLTTYTRDDSLHVVAVPYDGQLRLTLIAGTNRILTWEDIRGTGTSWGRLKLQIRQQIGT